jgi:hypothetical protein
LVSPDGRNGDKTRSPLAWNPGKLGTEKRLIAQIGERIMNDVREKGVEEIAEDFQHMAYLALRDEVEKENAICVEALSNMLRRRFKRIVRDCREALAVMSCLRSQFDGWEPTDLTQFLTGLRDAEERLAWLNKILGAPTGPNDGRDHRI